LNEEVLVLLNLNPLPKTKYRIGVPKNKTYVEILNSDDSKYWGSGITNEKLTTEAIKAHGFDQSIEISLPPLGAVILK
jgi:1,4-alpha-glucan branching enzyme